LEVNSYSVGRVKALPRDKAIRVIADYLTCLAMKRTKYLCVLFG